MAGLERYIADDDYTDNSDATKDGDVARIAHIKQVLAILGC